MMKVYGLLIRKYNMELEELGWSGLLAHREKLMAAQDQYSTRIDRISKRLEREYGFTQERFWELQEQSPTF